MTIEKNAPDAWRLASASRQTTAITGATTTNPVVVTAPSHGLTNTEVIAIYNIGGEHDALHRGMTELNNAFFTVASATRDTFALAGVDGRTFTPYQSGGTIYRVYVPNRAATYVYGLDYSAWTPREPGTYRIQVPGLGVSDPFQITDDIWHQVAFTSAKGEYHQRSSCPLDGRFGYRRPSSFNGNTDVPLPQSSLPYAWTNLAGVLPKSQIGVEFGATAPWITDKTVGAQGGWFDAGDYVTRIADAAYASYILLDVYEYLPSARRETNFNILLSSQVLDRSLYFVDMGQTCLQCAQDCRPLTWIGGDQMSRNKTRTGGANQVGLCFTSGLGSRNTIGTLYADAQYGIAGGAIPSGITNYAWSGQLPASALNFRSGPLNFIVENAAPNTPMTGQPGLIFESDFENERQLSHPRICYPQDEAIFENPMVIEQMEFTTQQTIIPQQVVAMYLDGWDRNAPAR
jgi:hypothetical protein